MKALRTILHPLPAELPAAGPFSTNGFSETRRPQQMCNPRPQLWQTNARSKIHDPFFYYSHRSLDRCEEPWHNYLRTHTLFPQTLMLPPHLHSRKPLMLTRPARWKIISGEFKTHFCWLLTRTVSSWKERISKAQITKRVGKQKRRAASWLLVNTGITEDMWKQRARLTLQCWKTGRNARFVLRATQVPIIVFLNFLFLLLSLGLFCVSFPNF